LINIHEILERESIRLLDGRWSGGFVDEVELQQLIDNGKAEVYDNQGVKFVQAIK